MTFRTTRFFAAHPGRVRKRGLWVVGVGERKVYFNSLSSLPTTISEADAVDLHLFGSDRNLVAKCPWTWLPEVNFGVLSSTCTV
jgi:hypothetical protein